MAEYIDQVYFDENSDVVLTASEFNFLNNRAEAIINALTRDLQGYDLTELPEITQNKVKKAVVAQIEALYLNGGLEATAGGSVQSASIGSFSYSEGGGLTDLPISPMVRTYLGFTGLLYTGVIAYE